MNYAFEIARFHQKLSLFGNYLEDYKILNLKNSGE